MVRTCIASAVRATAYLLRAIPRMKKAAVTVTVYHGSPKLFDKFGLEETAQGVLWFSEDRDKIVRGESGANSSKYIYTVDLHLDRPAGWGEYDKYFLAQLKQNGYDGIKLDDDWVAFDPKDARIVGVEERQPDGNYKRIR
ncbi:MAG: hypothetical protein GF334_03445 [Candidatus Altiarchaeales archaeon]|nr:hypothetical protein [Candidatus Altiarchaeales archaeon]